MQIRIALLTSVLALMGSSHAYYSLEARDALPAEYDSWLETRDADAEFDFEDSILSARDIYDLELRDAYETGHADGMARLLPRWPPANHPTLPKGSLSNLGPSRPHDVPHHNWNSPVPSKPKENSGSYFPHSSSHGGSSSKPGGRRASFKRRWLLDEEDMY